MQAEIGKLLQAIAFFSRLILPQGLWRLAAPFSLHQCAVWFPVAGLLIGIVPAAVYVIASAALPAFPAALVAIAAGMFVTGALHEDGLADTADGLGGGASRGMALEIMRDSRIGAFGALALIVSVCLRAAALASVTPLPGAAALLIAHSSARGAIAFALAFSSYARKEGTGALVAPGISASRFAVTAGVSLAIALAFGLLSGFAAGVAGFAAAGLVLWRFQRRIGGYTGDCLGAMEQAAEIGVLLVLSAAWSAS